MTNYREILRGNVPVGGPQPVRTSRRFELLAKDFTSVEQGVPLRLVYGQARVAAVQITPVFGLRSEAIQSDAKKGAGAGAAGYRYWGSYAAAICHGPLTRLHSISNGETVIWSGGPIDISAADGDGKTTLSTKVGTIHFYWGTETQVPNELLESLEIDQGSGPATVPIPAWRRVVYVVCQGVSFGRQTTPPTLTFHVERVVEQLDLTAHDIDGDAVIPEAVYDLLADDFYGAGIEADLDEESFVEAAELVIDEGLGASPDIDSKESVRDVVGRMLSYVDGFLYVEGGKVKMGLTRAEDSSLAPEISEADLEDEPTPRPEGFDQTWNRTIVTFTDRSNKWEETSEDFDDSANAAIAGRTVSKTFNFPWITQRAVAKQLAKLIGIRGGLPTCFWEVSLKPKWRTLKPGDLVRLSYAKLGIEERVMRVKRVGVGGPSNPDVSVTLQEEQTRDASNDYLAPDDNFAVPGTLGENGSGDFELGETLPRLSWLPDDLKAGKADGILIACHRPDAFTISAAAYWTWNTGSQAYRSLGAINGFPAKGTVLAWHKIRTSNWLLRVELSALDYEWLQAMAEQVTEFYGVVGRRDVKTTGTPNDEHQVMAPWLKPVDGGRFELITANIIDIEVEGAAFGTDDLLLETAGADGRFPTIHCYFGRLQDFFILPTSTVKFERNLGNAVGDTDKKRYVKVTVANHLNVQDLADVTAVNYDRNDTTMCADGTLSENWGEYALTTQEVVDTQFGLEANGDAAPDYADVEDLDGDLGDIALGSGSADQILNLEHVDQVIGSIIIDGHKYYNTP